MSKLAQYDRALSSVEVWSGLGLIAWGLWIRIDRTPLTDFATYEPISRISDNAWIFIALATGGFQVLARIAEKKWARLVTTFGAMIMYKIIAVSNMVSTEPTPGAVIVCAWALADAAVLIRIAR